MHGGGIGDALRHTVIHRLDDSWDGENGNGAEGDGALKRVEGDRDHFGVFRRTAHKDGPAEILIFSVLDILSSKQREKMSNAKAHEGGTI